MPDYLPTRLPRLDRYGHAWCLVCGRRNGHAVAGDGLCDECRDRDAQLDAHMPYPPARYGRGSHVLECGRCHQSMVARIATSGQIPPGVCDSCRVLDRASQGESVRLFEPAPTQISGQLGMSDESWIADYNADSKRRLNYRDSLSD